MFVVCISRGDDVYVVVVDMCLAVILRAPRGSVKSYNKHFMKPLILSDSLHVWTLEGDVPLAYTSPIILS